MKKALFLFGLTLLSGCFVPQPEDRTPPPVVVERPVIVERPVVVEHSRPILPSVVIDLGHGGHGGHHDGHHH